MLTNQIEALREVSDWNLEDIAEVQVVCGVLVIACHHGGVVMRSLSARQAAALRVAGVKCIPSASGLAREG